MTRDAPQVEISKGSGNEDFYVAVRVDAVDGYNPTKTVIAPNIASGTPPAVLRTVICGLSPRTEFGVRIIAIAR